MEGCEMKISLVTDEISADFETAVELGVEWGIHDFELRGYDTVRVPNFSGFQQQRIQEVLQTYDARLIAISPGLFKFEHPSRQREHFPVRSIDAALYQRWQAAHDQVRVHCEELLPASIEFAGRFGISRIIAFSFHRGVLPPGLPPDEVLETLERAAGRVGEAGMQLCLEVENQHWADTGSRSADLVKAINHPALKVNWDPGNAFEAGDQPYPAGYEAAKPFVAHVHFKDVSCTDSGGHLYAVNGAIDWQGQVSALLQDGYQGYISVESHMQPKVSSARALLNRLRELIKTAG